MADKQTFTVLLEKHPTMNATGITIPFDVEKVFGAKRVPVKATINGAEYRGSVVRMGGKYLLGIPKEFRERAKIDAGAHIVVTLEKDIEERTVKVPKDLADALARVGMRDRFDKMSFTHRKEHVRAIEEAKAAETRKRRIEKAVKMVAAAGTK
jgi:bifunctional DNA-binding transcriptional regulator/antitoxin component of YhaV-PrlF toxin-antitoxin module